MRTFLILLATIMLCASPLSAQQQVKSVAERVTLFINGAQVTRTQAVTVPAGESTLTFTGLSPYMDAKSIQIRAKGNLTVRGVSHHFNHLDSLERSKHQLELEQKLARTERQLKEAQAVREVLTAEEELLKTNCSVGNRNSNASLAAIKELNDYYASRLLELRKKRLAQEEEQRSLGEERKKLQQALAEWGAKQSTPVSEVSVKVDAPVAGKGIFTLTYYVKNAGWFPSYDVRSEGLSRPVALSYKANIFQSCGEEWKNVALTLSSSNPNLGNVAPQLRTYWLDFGLSAPDYHAQMLGNTVSGTVMDEQHSPMIGANVMVEGSTIGAVTDVNGHYSITLPAGKRNLTFSFVGYTTQSRQVTGNTLNVILVEDKQALQESVVVGYASRKASVTSKEAANLVLNEEETALEESPVMEVEQSQTMLSYEFEIKEPQTILSDGKPVVAEIGRYELPARYYYRCVPRADKDAFLMAEVTDWNRLNLLEGEANICFENAYVGQSILNPNQQGDTLHFSLGRDSGIRIQRTKSADYTSRRLAGASKIQTTAWKTEIRNTRQEAIELTMQDQIPVSRNSAIVVTAEELSGGKLDEATGIVTWTLRLQPGEQRELMLQYRVKYPKGQWLFIE